MVLLQLNKRGSVVYFFHLYTHLLQNQMSGFLGYKGIYCNGPFLIEIKTYLFWLILWDGFYLYLNSEVL